MALSVKGPFSGLNAQLAAIGLPPTGSAEGTENVTYEKGLIKTPFGFSAIDCATGLNSGDIILALFQWRETDNSRHVMAVTTEKIYDHNRVTEDWDDKTQSGVTMSSNVAHPISYAEVGHDDTDIYLDESSSKAHAYHHVIVCDGGMSDIQRWAGKWETDFADLLGGDDYHDGTTHRALQVLLSSYNRIILISPYEYETSSASWVENSQKIRWPTIGKIQTWTGTGSGAVHLRDTGGINVWAASLGTDTIIYQSRGIWSINYIGGTTVFDPRPMIDDVGLLTSHTLVDHKNVHYFMGTDYNIHAYYGGGLHETIGNPVHNYILKDLDNEYETRCWLTIGQNGQNLWVFIVPSGSVYATKAYVLNRGTGSWTARDFSAKFGTGTGISAVGLAGAESYTIGDTYTDVLALESGYDISDAGDATQRYGDVLMARHDANRRTLAADYSSGTWGAGGFDYSKAGENFSTDFTENDLLVVFDGSDTTNVRYGTQFYTVYDVSTNGFSIYGTQDISTQGDHGIADNSTNTPADLSVDDLSTLGFYSVCSEDEPGSTYEQKLEDVYVGERLLLGDATGYIYQLDETYTSDAGNNIKSRHLSPVLDAEHPENKKLWPGLVLSARGTSLTLRHRTSDFDTSETGWIDQTQDLTTEFKTYPFGWNVTSELLQFAINDFSGDAFEVQSLTVLDPLMEGNR